MPLWNYAPQQNAFPQPYQPQQPQQPQQPYRPVSPWGAQPPPVAPVVPPMGQPGTWGQALLSRPLPPGMVGGQMPTRPPWANRQALPPGLQQQPGGMVPYPAGPQPQLQQQQTMALINAALARAANPGGWYR